MENLLLGLKVAAIGIIAVFVVLIILMGAIKLFEYLIEVFTKKKSEKSAAPQSVPAAALTPAAAVASEDESEIVAVISAAIMAILSSENAGNVPSFEIKKIKLIKRN